LGVTIDEIAPRQLPSPAQLEKLIEKGAFEPLCQFIGKAPSKQLWLVPETDARPAVSGNDLAMFSTVEIE
jgi:hypothetical protein